MYFQEKLYKKHNYHKLRFWLTYYTWIYYTWNTAIVSYTFGNNVIRLCLHIIKDYRRLKPILKDTVRRIDFHWLYSILTRM